MIAVQVDHYPGAGEVATLSPHLWLIVDAPLGGPREARSLLQTCKRCRQRIETFGFWTDLGTETEPIETALRCSCLLIVYAPPIFKRDVLANWPEFIQLQAWIEARLAPTGRN